MNIQLGQKIRTLRKQRNISQEMLAGHLGVTFQAVSRWENELAMPDVALIPAIASFFGVSTDELFDYNLYEIEQKIRAIVDEYSRFCDSDRARAEQILREGLLQYPGNDTLLNCLVGTLPVPERSEEVISLCRQLIDNTRYDDVKYDACRILAEAYASVGEISLARDAIEKIPEIYFSKLSVMAWILPAPEKWEAARKQKWIAFEDLLQMMGKIAECLEDEGKYAEALDECDRAARLLEVMQDQPWAGCWDNYIAAVEKQRTRLREHLNP